MKKLSTLILLVCMSASLAFAQAPQAMNYQAIARDGNGLLHATQNISLRITITDGSAGPTLFQETHTTTTNQFGLFTLNVGMGSVVTGNFATITWGTVNAWMAVEYDPAGGSNYMLMGQSQLLSVPYAMYAADGNPGPQGPQGPQGIQGPPGGSANLNGTTNYVTKFTPNGTTGGNSQLFDNGTNIGLGTTTPVAKFHIKGSADTSQLVIDANSTQSNTNPLIRIKNANGADLIWINSDDSTNIFIGKNSGSANIAGITGLGKNNTFIGSSVGYSNTIGLRNTAIGWRALFANTSGSNNTADGYQALAFNINGDYNTAIGFNTLSNNNSGNRNTGVGSISLFSNIDGVENTAIGSNSLHDNTTGDGNSAFGFFALNNNNIGSNNIGVGRYADVASNSLVNSIVIGSFSLVDSSNKVRIGNASMLSIGGQVGWSTYSDARVKNKITEDIKGLEFVKQLRPVTFHYDIKKQQEMLGRIDTTDWPGKYDIEEIPFSGFIAQEVEKAAKESNYNFSGIDRNGTILGLRYAEFVVPLVKAVQEQQEMIESLFKQNEEMIKRLEILEAK